MNARDIDRATIATWPAAETAERNGWFFLAAGGVTGRVNACWPLDWRGGDPEAAITDAEAWYAARQLPARFKLTDGAFAPTNLPELLTLRGYEPVAPTLIMVADLGAAGAPHDGVTLSPSPPPAFDQALQDSTPDADELAERRSIANRLPQPAAFAMREKDGRVLAVGASAIADKLAGVFLMRTMPLARRQGHGLQILRALLGWARTQGGAHAFLQVDAANAPAIALYRREGFVELSTYRFWRKPPR
ncbi:MAG: GNAT family N-acetyltransferase [Hyphomonadaceae bacterium]